MKNATPFRATLLFLVLIALAGLAPAVTPEKSKQKAPAQRQEEQATITATVESIDYPSREITLKTDLGDSETYVVDKQVQRFDEIKVGDMVRVDYFMGYVAELRPPTADEAKHPLVVLDSEGKSTPGAAPSISAAREVRAVVTIEGLDRPTRAITVKGPQGRFFTAHVEDVAKLEKLHIGETIVVTFSLSVAVSVEKVPARN